jgi:hypothetical protein
LRGHVADDESFVNLVDRLVTAVESRRRLCSPLLVPAGAALLDIKRQVAGAWTAQSEVDLLAAPD